MPLQESCTQWHTTSEPGLPDRDAKRPDIKSATKLQSLLKEQLRSSTKNLAHTGKQAEGEYTDEEGPMETWKVPTTKAIQVSMKTMIARQIELSLT
jgi:hypothetical protein